MVNVLCLVLSLLPVASPASRPIDLQQEISDLRREIQFLRQENFDLKKRLSAALIQLQKPATKPSEIKSAQSRNFKPGDYKIFNRDGLTYIKKHCDTLDDALRYARNMKWELQVIYDADTGEPIYPGIIPVTEKPPPFELKD